ncbi:helix-hairpin-helix domain-containing protein [Halorubrum rubrum]|uniref:Helix-hairpin-helix domain-containing protein n=1 Tax=Halorubrum rubrum TaxID=1126240 RepID=A0ABD5R1Q1_9EURY|nr:helix-hairpin-helix domain-containing protein [Halorubrum rubrum]
MIPLEEIYGIGDVRAARLREHGLESVGEVANAPIDGLADLLDGVGRQRARQVRASARRIAAEEGADRPSSASSAPDDGYVTTRRVPAADAVVVVPGRAFLTRAGGTDHPQPWRHALASVPGEGLLESEPTSETVVLCSPDRTAAASPGLYEALADAEDGSRPVGGSAPRTEEERDGDVGSFLAGVLRPGTLIPGDALRDLYARRPDLESELDAVLRNGTALRRGESFDLEAPAEATLLASTGTYLRGDRVLPEGAAFEAGAMLPGEEPPRQASFLAPGVVAVPGRRALGSLDADAGGDPALALLRAGGMLLPPDAVRER